MVGSEPLRRLGRFAANRMSADRVPARGSAASAAADLWRFGVLQAMALGSLIGLFGKYWDVAWHIDKGGHQPLSPPHILAHAAIAILLLVTVYGFVRDRRTSPLHLRVGRVRLHPGLLIAVLAAVLELFFVPAEILWHQLYGADIVVWTPLHLAGVLGLILLTFAGLVTAWLERHLAGDSGRRRLFGSVALIFAAILLGWFSFVLAEFEYLVPVFPMLWHPLLLTGLPVFALVLIARLGPVPFAASLTALGFTGVRLLLATLLMMAGIVDLAGQTRPAIPVLLLAGVAADLLLPRFPLWLSGLAIGAASLVVNAPLALLWDLGWHPGALLPGLIWGLLLAVVMAYSAAWVAGSLEPRPLRRPR